MTSILDTIENIKGFLQEGIRGFKPRILNYIDEIKRLKAVCLSYEREIVTGLIIILVGFFSYGLGVMSSEDEDGQIIYKYAQNLATPIVQDNKTAPPQTYNSGLFVASSKGKKYYPIDCTAAKSLSEANKIYFKTEEEAIKGGYSKSISCK